MQYAKHWIETYSEKKKNNNNSREMNISPEYEVVSGRPHLSVSDDYNHHKSVTEQPNHHYQAEYDRHQESDYFGEGIANPLHRLVLGRKK